MTKESIELVIKLTENRERMGKILEILDSQAITFVGRHIICGASISEEKDKDLIDGIRELVQAKYDEYNQQIEEL